MDYENFKKTIMQDAWWEMTKTEAFWAGAITGAAYYVPFRIIIAILMKKGKYKLSNAVVMAYLGYVTYKEDHLEDSITFRTICKGIKKLRG